MKAEEYLKRIECHFFALEAAGTGDSETFELLKETQKRLGVVRAKTEQARLRELDQMDAHGEKPYGRIEYK